MDPTLRHAFLIRIALRLIFRKLTDIVDAFS